MPSYTAEDLLRHELTRLPFMGGQGEAREAAAAECLSSAAAVLAKAGLDAKVTELEGQLVVAVPASHDHIKFEAGVHAFLWWDSVAHKGELLQPFDALKWEPLSGTWVGPWDDDLGLEPAHITIARHCVRWYLKR